MSNRTKASAIKDLQDSRYLKIFRISFDLIKARAILREFQISLVEQFLDYSQDYLIYFGQFKKLTNNRACVCKRT